METKEIDIPKGYKAKEIKKGKIILEKIYLPETWERCMEVIGRAEFIRASNLKDDKGRIIINEFNKNVVPTGLTKPLLALCQLLICRNAWWKQLKWKPDLKSDDIMYVIRYYSGNISTDYTRYLNFVLAFPTKEVRDQFVDSFRDLIEEAKELL